MIKVFSAPEVDKFGEPTSRVIWHPGMGDMEKFASEDRIHPKVHQFIDTIKPKEDHTYKLLTALGAADFWGQNRNGDRFNEKSLLLPGPKYGHQSFMNAGLFRYHKNKNPNESLGKVMFVFYNPKMRRVELVADYDHSLLNRFGSRDYLDLLNPDYSMAARVPWDRCSCCSDTDTFMKAIASATTANPSDQVIAVKAWVLKNGPIKGLAFKREQYCDHLKYMMNQVMGDGPMKGIQVGCLNDIPEFFDISQVLTGAATEAKEMKKVASVQNIDTGGAELAEELGYKDWEPAYEKTASVDKPAEMAPQAAIDHEADIDKEVDMHGVTLSMEGEERIPKEELEEGNIEEVLSSLGSIGIALTPVEFQRMLLDAAGEKTLGRALDRAGAVFPPSDESAEVKVAADLVNPDVVRKFMGHMENRSFFVPVANRRLEKIATDVFVKSGNTGFTPGDYSQFSSRRKGYVEVINPKGELANTLSKVASLYRGYREELAHNAIPLVRCSWKLPEVRQAVSDGRLPTGSIVKGAMAPVEILTLGSMFPLLYLYAAHLRGKEKDEEKLGLIRKFVKDHPALSAVGVAGLLKALVFRRP